MSCDSTKQPSEPQAAQSHFLLDPSDGSGAPGVSRCFLDTAQKRVALETPRGKGRFFFFSMEYLMRAGASQSWEKTRAKRSFGEAQIYGKGGNQTDYLFIRGSRQTEIRSLSLQSFFINRSEA